MKTKFVRLFSFEMIIPASISVGTGFKGVDLETFQTNVVPPRFAAFEGFGSAVYFVVSRLP